MKYLHSLKIIYRDLKPDNVLLDKDYHPHISDFGTAKISDCSFSSLLMESYNGSPLYMAPEMINDDPYTYKVDIFSFSILAYELITNAFPYPGLRTLFTIQSAVIKGKRPDLSLIPDEEIQDLLIKCWSHDPKNRPDFSEIVEIIKNESFRKAMNADLEEVVSYLRFFDDEIPLCSSGANKNEERKIVNLEIRGITKSSTSITINFISQMKIKEIRNSDEFDDNIPFSLQQKSFFFFNNTKLDENLSFDFYNIKDNDTIIVCVDKCYLFRYKDETRLIYGKNNLHAMKDYLKELFNLPNSKFCIIKDNKRLMYNNSDKYPNGTVFDLKIPVKMNFLIDNKYTISVQSSEKINYIINKLDLSSNTQLINEDGKILDKFEYILCFFEDKGIENVYKLQTTIFKEFSFKLDGKFFNEDL